MTTGNIINTTTTENVPIHISVNVWGQFLYSHWENGRLINKKGFSEIREFKGYMNNNDEKLFGKYIGEEEYNILKYHIAELETRNVIKHLYLYKNDTNMFKPQYHVIYKCHKMDLFEAITKNGLPKPINKCIEDLLHGVNALHQRYIAHRDLKPENVVIDGDGNLIVIDFGLSKVYDKTDCEDNQTCGTPLYVPPEYKLCKWNVFNADLWALGITIYAMVFNSFPEIIKNNKLKYPVKVPVKYLNGDKVDKNLIYIIENMANVQPNLRIPPIKMLNELRQYFI